MGSGLIGLHMKDMFISQLFAFSRNEVALGWAVALESARPQDVKTSEYSK